MSFVSALKTITNKINSIAKEMDKKCETFADEVLSIVESYDADFFANSPDADRVDMKASIIKLFDMFQADDKKPKNINGYILFTKEQREACAKRNPDMSPTQLTSALSVEWKALDQSERDDYNTRAKSVAPQTEEEKRAKRSSSKKPSKPQVTCDYSGCDKVVKNPTQHTDGCTYCATHFKKVVSDEKKAATPKCQHVGKDDKKCVSDAVNGEWCTRHMKKSSPVVAPVAEPLAKLGAVNSEVAEKKAADKNKSVSKKAEEKPKSDKKSSVEEKLAAAEKKMDEAKAKASSPASAPASPASKFNFKTESPVKTTEDPEYWICVGIKFDGVNKSRLHKKTGLVLKLGEDVLEGTFINGKATKLDALSDDTKTWARKCGITVEDDEDMDMELDEELESEDEE
jgi:hypothetical protein